MSQVIYNNTEIFPVPLVTHSVQPVFRGDGRKLAYLDRYTLQGVVTGCQFSTVTGSVANIINIFSKDFANLEFRDTNFTGIASGVKITSLNFDNSSLVGYVPYTVELDSYPANFFESQGIIEKKNEYSIQQSEKGEFTLNHTIYAKGANTSSQYNNALTNAKNFVLLHTGLSLPSLFPFFITGFSGATLDSRSENINRLEGTYEITEQYVASSGLNVTKDYTINLESGTDGIITTSINGFFRAGKGADFNTARQAYSGFDSFSVCSGVYNHYRGITGLVQSPFLSSGVTEDYGTNTLNFTISFNDWPTVTYRHIPSVQVASGLDGIVTVAINSRIEGLGKLAQRYNNAYQFFTGLNIFNVANQAFKDYVGVGYPYPLNSSPLDSGVTDDRFAGNVEYNATFSNKSKALDCSGIKFFDVQYSKNYAMAQIAPIPIINSISGLDTLFLDYLSRGTISVQGDIVVEKGLTSIDATGAIRQFINGKFRREILSSGNKSKIRLESINLNQNINLDSASFNVVYSFDEPACVNVVSNNFIFVTGLVL